MARVSSDLALARCSPVPCQPRGAGNDILGRRLALLAVAAVALWAAPVAGAQKLFQDLSENTHTRTISGGRSA